MWSLSKSSQRGRLRRYSVWFWVLAVVPFNAPLGELHAQSDDPSGGGFLGGAFDRGGPVEQALDTAQKGAQGLKNASVILHGIVMDSEEEKEAAKKADERMEEMSPLKEYSDLQQRYESGDLSRSEKLRYNVMRRQIARRFEEEQIAKWEARTGGTWEAGKPWPVSFEQAASIAGGPEALIPLAGMETYFSELLRGVKPPVK